MISRAFGLIVMMLLAVAPLAAQDVKTYTSKAAFDDVKFELTNVIGTRGLAIQSEGNVALMLERTSEAVGATRAIYKRAEYVAFCSAKYSRLVMEADPRGLAFCPFTVFLYETAAKPGEVVVGFRRFGKADTPESAKAFAEAETLLDGIARDAVK